jgi:chemotaxis protein methyltransferase CheR
VSKLEVSTQEFLRFKRFLQDECGILLEDNKKYLVESRLNKLLESNNIENINKLIDDMASPMGKRLRDQVIDAMTTNETSWFRDTKPYNLLKDIIFKDIRESSDNIRIGSFACSSGQEAYSISMCLHEFKKVFPGSFHKGSAIIGLDISQEMLAKGMSATYSESEMSHGLSTSRKSIFFHKDKNGLYHVVDEIRDVVRFQQLNLLNSFILLGKFDVIFCRNVLFYFEPETRMKIIEKLYHSLNSNGYLILGGPESIGQYMAIDEEDTPNYFETISVPLGQYYRKLD